MCAALAAALVMSLAGCIGDQQKSQHGQPSPSASRPAPSATGPDPSRVPLGNEVTAKRALWQWRKLGAGRIDRSGVSGSSFDGRYLVANLRVREKADAMVVDTVTGRTVFYHHPDTKKEWNVQSVLLEAPWAVVLETNGDFKLPLETVRVRAFRYDLRTGARRMLAPGQGLPPTTPAANWDLRDGIIAFDSGDPDLKNSCINIMDVATLKPRKRYCAPAGSQIGRVHFGPGHAVTFQVAAGTDLEPCVTLHRLVAIDTAPPVAVPLSKPCIGFQGAGGPDWTATSQISPKDPHVDRSAGWGSTPDGTAIPLGVVSTGSVRTCGDWAYWSTFVTGGGRNPQVLLRWRPGSDIEVLFETAMSGLVSVTHCANGWITFNEANDHGVATYTAKVPS